MISLKPELLHFLHFTSFIRAPFDDTFVSKTDKTGRTGAAIARSSKNSCSKDLRDRKDSWVKSLKNSER